jgi:hypothetical protein
MLQLALAFPLPSFVGLGLNKISVELFDDHTDANSVSLFPSAQVLIQG